MNHSTSDDSSRQLPSTSKAQSHHKLKLANVKGYEVGDCIGGGGFSRWASAKVIGMIYEELVVAKGACHAWWFHLWITMAQSCRVYRAYNHSIPAIAACKVVIISSSSSSQQSTQSQPNGADLKDLTKEVQVHRILKHDHVLEFKDSLMLKQEEAMAKMEVPGLYMLLELAMGGDLFDKIGE